MIDFDALLIRAAICQDPQVRATLKRSLETLRKPLDPRLLQMIQYALDFASTTGFPLTIEGAGPYAEIVAAVSGPMDIATTYWAVAQLNQRHDEDTLSQTLLQTLKILKLGDRNDGVISRGMQDALDYIRARLPRAEIPCPGDCSDLAAEYVEREQRGVGVGLQTGYSVLDSVTDGQEPGELWVCGAYTGEGKSFLLQNIAYHWRMRGLTGLYVSTEQSSRQIKRRLCIRHAKNPIFNLEAGISYTDVKFARLSGVERQLWLDRVIPDWDSDHYATIIIRTAPHRAPFDWVAQSAEEEDSRTRLDYVIVDYLSQLRPSRPRGNEREEQTELVIEAKQFALTFGGRSIPVLTAAQTNPTSYLQALQTGYYPLRAIADSAEFERSSDLLFYLLRRDEDKQLGQIKSGVLKYRDGRDVKDLFFLEDFDHSYIADKTVEDSAQSVWQVKA